MKTLVLIRHAKSDWGHHELSDFDRPLNKRGQKDAPAIARRLKGMGINPDLILSSPANRARTTACLILSEYKNEAGKEKEIIKEIPSLYLGSPNDLTAAIDRTEERIETLFLIAHNPGISYLASILGAKEIPMPTCCAVVLTLEGTWKDFRTEQFCVLKPKDFSRGIL